MGSPGLRHLLLLAALALPGCLCDPAGSSSSRSARPDLSAREVREETRPSSLRPPPREPGPPRDEPQEKVDAAAREARRLSEVLTRGGVAPREVASVADMRGYRLYRRRLFRQAQVWFDTATEADPSFEPALLNAARCAMLLRKPARARELLDRLKSLDTPLARSRLVLARDDPDLIDLWAER